MCHPLGSRWQSQSHGLPWTKRSPSHCHSAGGKAPLPPEEGLSTPKPHKGDAGEAAPVLPSPSCPLWLLGAQGFVSIPTELLCIRGWGKQPPSCAWQLLWQPYIFLMVPNDLLAFALIYGSFGCRRLPRLPSAHRSSRPPCRVRWGLGCDLSAVFPAVLVGHWSFSSVKFSTERKSMHSF